MACRLGQSSRHTDAASQVKVAAPVLLVPRDKQREGGVRRKGRVRAARAVQVRGEDIEAVQAVHRLRHYPSATRAHVRGLMALEKTRDGEPEHGNAQRQPAG